MRNLMIVFTALVVGSGTALADEAKAPATAAPAQEAKAPAPAAPAQKAAKKPKSMSRKGELTAVDVATNTITIKDAKGVESKSVVTAETKITKGGKKIAIGDLMVGDKVAVTCVGEGADMKCTAIKVLPAKKK
jgi:hypothetical protein